MLNEFRKYGPLIERIAPKSRLVRYWPLKGGISAGMTALEIEDADGKRQKLIVRQPGDQTLSQNLHAAEDEFRVLEITHSLGLATPRPFLVDPSGMFLDSPFLIIEYFEGRLEFDPLDVNDFVRQMAAYLAKIHSIDDTKADLVFLPRKTAEVTGIFEKISGEVEPSFQVERIRDMLEKALPYPQRNASVLLHGDFWPGNTLWQNDHLEAVIDWEDACRGDPLSDLAISRLDILWIFGIGAFHTFTDVYQSLMPIDISSLPYWDLDAALRLARLAGADLDQWAAFFRPYGRPDITTDTIRRDYQFFIDQAFDMLS
jgi:aminoglycoside phosphotransferase (APT) family kinase protein